MNEAHGTNFIILIPKKYNSLTCLFLHHGESCIANVIKSSESCNCGIISSWEYNNNEDVYFLSFTYMQHKIYMSKTIRKNFYNSYNIVKERNTKISIFLEQKFLYKMFLFSWILILNLHLISPSWVYSRLMMSFLYPNLNPSEKME